MVEDNLSGLHDCEKCHGKIVAISIDKLGVTRCGYCGLEVDYEKWTRKQHPEIWRQLDQMKIDNIKEKDTQKRQR